MILSTRTGEKRQRRFDCASFPIGSTVAEFGEVVFDRSIFPFGSLVVAFFPVWYSSDFGNVMPLTFPILKLGGRILPSLVFYQRFQVLSRMARKKATTSSFSADSTKM
jgi:hypothetical protein